MIPLTTPEQRIAGQATRRQTIEAWELCTAGEFIDLWLPEFERIACAERLLESGRSDRPDECSLLYTVRTAQCKLAQLSVRAKRTMTVVADDDDELDDDEMGDGIDPNTVATVLLAPEPGLDAVKVPRSPYRRSEHRWLDRTLDFLTTHGQPATAHEIAAALNATGSEKLKLNAALHQAYQNGRIIKAGSVPSGVGRQWTLWTIGENNGEQKNGHGNGSDGDSDNSIFSPVQPPVRRYANRRPGKYG
jgi:hypothetical protein